MVLCTRGCFWLLFLEILQHAKHAFLFHNAKKQKLLKYIHVYGPTLFLFEYVCWVAACRISARQIFPNTLFQKKVLGLSRCQTGTWIQVHNFALSYQEGNLRSHHAPRWAMWQLLSWTPIAINSMVFLLFFFRTGAIKEEKAEFAGQDHQKGCCSTTPFWKRLVASFGCFCLGLELTVCKFTIVHRDWVPKSDTGWSCAPVNELEGFNKLQWTPQIPTVVHPPLFHPSSTDMMSRPSCGCKLNLDVGFDQMSGLGKETPKLIVIFRGWIEPWSRLSCALCPLRLISTISALCSFVGMDHESVRHTFHHLLSLCSWSLSCLYPQRQCF